MFISSVVYNKRSTGYFLKLANVQIANLCKENNHGFIDHSNLNSSHLDDDALREMCPNTEFFLVRVFLYSN